MGRYRAWAGRVSLLGFGSCLRFGCFIATLKHLSQWAEGARLLFVRSRTPTVQFHLWASVSHSSAVNESSWFSCEVFEEILC